MKQFQNSAGFSDGHMLPSRITQSNIEVASHISPRCDGQPGTGPCSWSCLALSNVSYLKYTFFYCIQVRSTGVERN